MVRKLFLKLVKVSGSQSVAFRSPASKITSFFFFFLMWTICQVFIELVTTLPLLFIFWFLTATLAGSHLADQDLNLHSRHWKAKF